MFGKWHCGWLPWFSPIKSGFEIFFGNLDGAMDYFSHIDSAGLPDLYEGEIAIEEVGYYTHLVTDRVVDYLAAADASKPFYLQVNFTAPHWPWEGPDDQDVSERVTAAMAENPLAALFNYEGGSLEKYAELVEVMDEGIGKILSALRNQGLEENTIVVFMSDNGGERFSFQWPFVGEKGALEEGGIRVPFILRWPAVVSPGQVCEMPVDTMDVTAMALAVAGITPSDEYALDGTNLIPWLLDGAEFPQRDLMWRTQEQGAIRRGRFKLLIDRQAKPLWLRSFSREGERVRLIEVTDDARERKDLSGDHPDLVRDLVARWRTFDEEMLPYSPSVHVSGTRSRPD
jgi:arylsulfatase A-like enzyme